MPKTVLVVDDDPLFQTTIRDGLVAAGYEVALAGDGLAALERIREAPPDFILLDLILPKLDGIRTCKLLKRHPHHRAIPVILLTGLAGEGLKVLGDLGADGVVAKRQFGPTISEILNTLRGLESAGGPPRPPEEAAHGLRERRIVSELVAERQHVQTLLATLGEGVVELDEGGRVVYLNPAASQILDRIEDELLGTPGADLLGSAHGRALQEGLRQVQAGSGEEAVRLELTHGPKTLGLTVTVLPRLAGPPGALLVMRDITDLTRRARSLQALAAVEQHILGKLDLQDLLREIVTRTADLLGAERCGLFQIEPEGTQLRLRCIERHGLSERYARDHYVAPGETVVGKAVAEHRPVATADFLQDPSLQVSAALRTLVQEEGIGAVLAAPILVGEEAFGALAVYRPAGHRFSPEEVDLVTSLAGSAAIAIANARLYREAQARLETNQLQRAAAQALLEVSHALTQTLDLERVFDLIAEKVLGVTGADACGIARITAGGDLEYIRATGFHAPHFLHWTFLRGEGLMGRCLELGRSVWSRDLREDPAITYRPETEARAQVRGGLAVPIVTGEGPYGVLFIGRRSPHEHTPQEVAFVEALAAQAALAIQNARLYGVSEARRRGAEALADVGRLLAQSLDPEEVGQRIADAVRRLLRAQVSSLCRSEAGSGALAVLAVSGDAEPPFGPHFVFPIEIGLAGLAARERQQVSAPDVRTDPRITLTPEMGARADQGLFQAGLAVPLVLKDQLIGVLAVGDRAGRVFTREEIQLAQAFADQAALALENARLYAELRGYSQDLERRVEERTRQLVVLNRELEMASRHKSEFLANMSHELRTPLHAMVGFTDLLLGAPGLLTEASPEKRQHYLENIRASADRLIELINDMLDLAKIEAGRMTLDLKEVAVSAALHDAANPAKLQGLTKGLTLDLHLAETPETLLADPRKLQQIVGNLLSNAIKFTPAGGRITVEARGVPDPRGWALEVAVRDTGIGIAAADQKRLFQEFVQLDNSLGKRYPGTGLGLALTKRLVRLHHGRIWATSAGPGTGSTFTFRLPCRPAALTGEVLVVEDEETARAMLREALAERGLRVREAADGLEALRLLEAARPDLLLLDLHMPLLGGAHVIQGVRQRPETADLPILVVTGLGAEAGHLAVEQGANAYLTKPFTAEALIEAVERLLERRGAEARVTL